MVEDFQSDDTSCVFRVDAPMWPRVCVPARIAVEKTLWLDDIESDDGPWQESDG